MATVIDMSIDDPRGLDRAVAAYRRAERPVALTGAGISVESGIPDFRSPGGLWETYPPEIYASIDTFLEDPDRSWVLFREMGKTLAPASPNPAHDALARLEAETHLAGVITQNIDSLHQEAGSRTVVEIHGDYRHLQCLRCQAVTAAGTDLMTAATTPLCDRCRAPLKPNVVLFGEAIRGAFEIQELISGCDLLLVVGTSAVVYPAAAIPHMVRQGGGRLIVFDTTSTVLTEAFPNADDFLFLGQAGRTLSAFAAAALASP